MTNISRVVHIQPDEPPEQEVVVELLHQQPLAPDRVDRDFRFACLGWSLYTPESRRALETLFVAQSSSSRGRHLSPP